MIRIGTRGSPLARWQAEHVCRRLKALGQETALRPITTTGDRLLGRRLDGEGGKGLFLKEIEAALLDGEIDLAVHSLKDVPSEIPAELTLCAFLERMDPRDAWIATRGERLADLPAGARVGTSSLRRRAQILARRPDLFVADLRGNVETRLRHLREGRFDAIVLALAGLLRLGLGDLVTQALDIDECVPAPGQGVIALECRRDATRFERIVAPLRHAPTANAVAAERAFLAAIGGGCNLPLGAYAEWRDEQVRLRALLAHEDGASLVRGERVGSDPAAVGRHLARELLTRSVAAGIGAFVAGNRSGAKDGD